jgi:pSer/pThr/pTyr-binding forkhead associated (FHA) protein
MMKAKARLSVYRDGKAVQSFPIPDEGTRIGRVADNFVQFTDSIVSKRHAEIRPESDGWVIRDTCSRNGVLANGQRLESSRIKNGDRIVIGPFLLVFETKPADSDWVPSHVIDFSTHVGQQTVLQIGKKPAAVHRCQPHIAGRGGGQRRAANRS